MSKTAEQIVAEFRSRQMQRGPFLEQCRVISQLYDNKMVLPLPELDKTEAPAVANLAAQGIDQHAMRVASVLPDIDAAVVKPGDNASEKRATNRRRAAYGFWEINAYRLLQKKRARWLVAYAESPVWIIPDRKLQAPKWVVRTPLETFPGQMDTGQMRPDDCIFAVTKPVSWVRSTYPEIGLSSIVLNTGPYSKPMKLQDDDLVEVIQWVDQDETVVVITGPGECEDMSHGAEWGYPGQYEIRNLTPPSSGSQGQWGTEILRYPNRAGCNIVVPGRITLGGPKGQFDDVTGLYTMQAKLMAMEVNAVANGIWPDQWMIGDGQTPPKIIKAADGRRGIVGEVQAQNFITTQLQPGLQTPVVIDRLERAQRLNGAIPADFGGESASNIRTGRRGDAVLSAAVDYTIQEHQQILERSATHELDIASLIDLEYFRGSKKSFYVSMKGGKGRLDYTPKDIWTEDRTLIVSYAKTGADVNALNVQIGQLTGVGLLSKKTAARIHPDIQDPDFEHAQTLREQLEQAVLTATQQAAAGGTLPLVDVARIAELLESNDGDLIAAVQKAHEEAQKRQATTVNPAAPGSPEAQPGLSPPDQGAEAGTTIGPPTPSMDNLTQILRGLRTQQQVAAG